MWENEGEVVREDGSKIGRTWKRWDADVLNGEVKDCVGSRRGVWSTSRTSGSRQRMAGVAVLNCALPWT